MIGRFHLRKLGLMLVSAVLAAGLWLVVAGEETVDRTMRVPMEFTNLPPRLEPVGETPDAVDVRVRGASSALARLGVGDLQAVVDLRQAKPGLRLFHLGPNDIRAPLSVEIVQVLPSSVTLGFEPTETKIVPVVPRLEGTPATGFRVGPVVSDPATVVIAGPSTAVRSLAEAVTEPVSVAGAATTVSENVTVGVTNPLVRVPSTRHVRVTVTLTGAP